MIEKHKVEILGNRVSEELNLFVQVQGDKIQKEFCFRPISEHPFPSYRNQSACYESDEHSVTIWIDQSAANAEFLVAHEIMHGVLEREGFPHTSRPASYARHEWVALVGSQLASTIIDPIVNARLHDYDIADPMMSTTTEKKMKQLADEAVNKGEPGDFGPRFCCWALDYLYAELDPTLDRTDKERFKLAIGRAFPRIRTIGKKLIKAVRKTGCCTPDQALQAMICTRDMLKLRGKCLIQNKTGENH